MSQKRLEQRLISFIDTEHDLERIRQELANGWFFVSLVVNNGYYVGILEKKCTQDHHVYIPPRKKIKFSL